MKYWIYVTLALALALLACDGGLEPVSRDKRAFVRGEITVSGVRPHVDSLKEIRVIGLKRFPSDSIISDIITGRADFSPASLPLDKDRFEYELEIKNPPAEVKFFGLVINTGGPLDWKMGAIYGAKFFKDSSYKSFKIQPGEIKKIDFKLNFDSLPDVKIRT